MTFLFLILFFLRPHCTLQVRGRGLCDECTFLSLDKKVPKKRAGAQPLDPASVCALLFRYASPRLRDFR